MKYYIGIDVGGSTLRGVLLGGQSPKILRRIAVPIPPHLPAFNKSLPALARFLAHNRKIHGIGIGLPGAVDIRRALIRRAANIPYLKNWSARRALASLRLPVRAENDSKCLAIAEARYGAGKGYRNVVAVSIGTGIGAGVFIKGKLYRGSHGSAGEIGHTIVDIHRKKTFEKLGAKTAFLKHGNRSSVIGVGIANTINTFDPEIVILGGGGGLSRHVNLKIVRRVAAHHTLRSLRGKTLIVKGKLGESAQAIGAALLFITPKNSSKR